jgi:TonB family protein
MTQAFSRHGMRGSVNLTRIQRLACVGICLFSALGALGQEKASSHIIEFKPNPAGGGFQSGSNVPLLYAPDPQYTEAARIANVKDAVVLRGLLGVDGCVRQLKIVRHLGYGLDESATYAVERWKFRPYRKDGVPTESMIQIEVKFDPSWSPFITNLPTKPCGQK